MGDNELRRITEVDLDRQSGPVFECRISVRPGYPDSPEGSKMILIFLCRKMRGCALVAMVAGFALATLTAPARAQDENYKPGSTKPAQRDKSTLKDEGKTLFGSGPDKKAGAPESAWCIVITSFRGDTQDADARDGLDKVRTQTGLREAYVEKRGEGTVIAYGRYADPSSKQARTDLDKVRNIEVGM